MLADDVDEEDRRPTQRRRLEDAQAGGFDENMEPLVSCCKHASLHNQHYKPPDSAAALAEASVLALVQLQQTAQSAANAVANLG